MKPYLSLLCTFFLLSSVAANAQQWRLNVSAGIENAKGAIAGISNGPVTARTGLGAGFDLEMNCSPVVSVQLGAHYSQQGFGVVNDDAIASATFDVITVPLLLRLKATNNLYFMAGPQFGLVVKAISNTNGLPKTDISEIIPGNDYYAVFGAGYRFNNNIFIDTRYQYGFNNMAENLGEDQNLKNRVLSLRVGYSFRLGASKKK